MKIKLGDYFIETDERQFKVRTYIGKDKDGKDLYKSIAYCTTLYGALKFIPQQALRDNKDINIVLDKLNKIEQEIKDMYDYVEMGIEYIKENGGLINE